MRRYRLKTAIWAMLVAFGVSLTAQAIAQEKAAPQDYGRRAQVNKRLHNQDKRINEQVREGKMSRAEASQLHQEHAQIRQQERALAHQQGGHITAGQQKALNQQENGVSQQIGH